MDNKTKKVLGLGEQETPTAKESAGSGTKNPAKKVLGLGEQEGSAKKPAKEKKYKAKKGTEGFVHLRICRTGFDSNTGKRLHKPYVAKMNKTDYEDLVLRGGGYEIQATLHRPKGFKEVDTLKAERKARIEAENKKLSGRR